MINKRLQRILKISKNKKKMKFSSGMIAIMAPKSIINYAKKKNLFDDAYDENLLHTTLIFLGKVDDKKIIERIRKTVERVCARHQPLKMKITGSGTFSKGEDGTPMFLVPNAKGLSRLQADLEEAISNIIDLPSEFGWVPHMTLGYSQKENPDTSYDVSKFPEWTATTVRFQNKGKEIANFTLGKISKKAEIDMNELPIMADPVMWSNEQIIKVLQTPILFQRLQKDKELFKKVLKEIEKRNIDLKNVINPKDIGEWLERGWFVLAVSGSALGWYRNIHDANLAKERLIRDFINGEDFENNPYPFFDENEMGYRLQTILNDEYHIDTPNKTVHNEIKAAIDRLQNNPFYKNDRKEFAEKFYDIIKIPENHNPSKKAVVSGAIPTKENVDSALDVKPYSAKLINDLVRQQDRSIEAEKEFFKREAESISKRQSIREKGVDPDKMADDMDQLPIIKDPVSWSNEQIIYILRNKQLINELKKDEEMLNAFFKEIKKRGITMKDVISLKDNEEWLEQGWFLLSGGGIPLGWYRNIHDANMAKDKLVEDLAEGIFYINGVNPFSTIYNDIMTELIFNKNIDVKNNKNLANEISNSVNDIARHHFYKNDRKQFGEKYFNIIKSMKAPQKESIVTGLTPTKENVKSLENAEYSKEVLDGLFNSGESSDSASLDLAKREIEQIFRKQKMREKGVDPDKMADDIKISSLNRMLKVAISIKNDNIALNRLKKQFNLYISRIGSDQFKTNLDYTSDSPWNGSVNDFMKRFPDGLSDFLKWHRKNKNSIERQKKLNSLKLDIKHANEEDVSLALKAIKLIKQTRMAHYIPEGNDNTDKFKDEPKLWSGDDKFKDIEEFLTKYRKHYNEANDSFALDAARDFIKYWSILLKKKKKRKRSK